MGHKLKIASWMAVGALAGALTTMQLQAVARNNMTPLPLEELQQLAAVFSMIKSDYVESTDEKKLITDAISGMVTNLDPHSAYYDKKAWKEFREGTSGAFVGVGIEITMEDGLVKVVSPIEDSPAAAAGLMTNDLITKIDTMPVKGLSITEAVKRMRGEPGTDVRLQVLRRAENRSFSVTITRARIITRSVKAKTLDNGYGWIRISQFQDRTVEDFAAKLEELAAASPQLQGLVLDLRNDPGGLLDAAVAVSAVFLPADVPVVSTNGQLEESRYVFQANKRYYWRRSGTDPLAQLEERTKGLFKTIPIVVLVNEGSASASEIVAGALQDYKRATIMGNQTFGKGSVQTVRALGPDTGLKITTARYYTPNGRSIQAKGIVPDVLVDETPEGNLFAALSTRESDLNKHLENGTEDPADAIARDKAREAAQARLEERQRENPGQRLMPEFGTDKDFRLNQALNHLQGKPVAVSKTLKAREADTKE